MTKIKDILTLNLEEDIKNVIDLEDRSELEIQQEIESYIVTEGLGRHLYNFVNLFASNIKETGVWLSGFYGSGKSYFGKILGYLIDNPNIMGTPARERILLRIKGVSDENLLENAIRHLDAIKSRVVFLDIAKQNTDKGLAFTLFSNFLKNLGFRDDVYGYMEYDLFIDAKLEEFKLIVKDLEGRDWDELKSSNRQVAKLMRKVYCKMDYSEADYAETLKLYETAINDFSAGKLKLELEKYLRLNSDEHIVFVFDEASEAISQKKFSLLDLEGISEALSSINSKVWTIAIAQEKLDAVINNANVSRSQLTKLTDRFKTKIHLESTEVDIIIRSRLLHKNKEGYDCLAEYYQKNEGLVSDATNLKSSFPTKTSDADVFAVYYPFHRYQFDILQKFLFSSNALVATQIAARGMIITAFDVLRKQMQEEILYNFTPGYAICTEAQTAPPPDLVSKYDTAKRILRDKITNIDGEKLLKTMHLLTDSELIAPTVENITKSYITDITSYYEIKPHIEKALNILLEAKVLLFSNHNYKITSDLEGKLLDEMHSFDVEFFNKKRSLINYLKDYRLFNPVAMFNDGADSFKFCVLSDQEDDLCSPGNKNLKLVVYSLFNINESIQDFIEELKLATQYKKDVMTLVPDNSEFAQIDKLLTEISRYIYMEDKYSNESDMLKKQIIREFSVIREEKEKDLRVRIERAYKNASLLYMFEEFLTDDNSFKADINSIQKKIIKNVFTKRLNNNLSESLVTSIFTGRKEDLKNIFSGNDFQFFDSHGNFVGDSLKVVDEINLKLKNRYVDGHTLESELSDAPWAYSFGTIVSTLAVLFRAGRLSVKYNGTTFFSYDQSGVREAFTNATKFRIASFRSVTVSLSTDQKNQAVQILLNLDISTHTELKVDWSVNDFELADNIRCTADHFIGALLTLGETVDDFDALFPALGLQKQVLSAFTGKITESNYIERVESLLSNRDAFSVAIQMILDAQKFIKTNFSKVKQWKRFIDDVVAEIKKAERPDTTIQSAYEDFTALYKQDMVKNFSVLRQTVQIVKDSYFRLIKNSASAMSHEYQLLLGKIDAVERRLKSCPADLNTQNIQKLNALKGYCQARNIQEPVLEYSVTCKNCGFSLSDILNYTELARTKENEIIILDSSIITQAPPIQTSPASENESVPEQRKPRRKVRLHLPCAEITVQKYRQFLLNQLSTLTTANPDEEIELEIHQ